ncbi:MAG: hypothetical protein JWM52_453 [Candidatus Saccharibacteria bacterium]|nr:hypothetical protein [Candidatus Saccharibacteria bacterium]
MERYGRLYPHIDQNFLILRNDFARFDSRLAEEGIDNITKYIVAYCEPLTADVACSFILGARILAIADAYNISEIAVNDILKSAAASVALGLQEHPIFVSHYESMEA